LNDLKRKVSMKIEMKKSAMTIAVLLSAVSCFAQAPTATPPPPPAAINGPMPGPGRMQEDPNEPSTPLIQLYSISGKVVCYLANERREYDGFTLQTSNGLITVKYPADLGQQLMKTSPKGSVITVNGSYDNTPDGQLFRFYSVKVGDNFITDTPPPVDQNPPAEQVKSFAGKISELNHDQRGMINGIVLNGNTLVALPPPAVEQLAPYLKTGTEIAGTGVKRNLPAGVVTEGNLDFTDARTLSIGGQTYLIR